MAAEGSSRREQRKLARHNLMSSDSEDDFPKKKKTGKEETESKGKFKSFAFKEDQKPKKPLVIDARSDAFDANKDKWFATNSAAAALPAAFTAVDTKSGSVSAIQWSQPSQENLTAGNSRLASLFGVTMTTPAPTAGKGTAGSSCASTAASSGDVSPKDKKRRNSNASSVSHVSGWSESSSALFRAPKKRNTITEFLAAEEDDEDHLLDGLSEYSSDSDSDSDSEDELELLTDNLRKYDKSESLKKSHKSASFCDIFGRDIDVVDMKMSTVQAYVNSAPIYQIVDDKDKDQGFSAEISITRVDFSKGYRINHGAVAITTSG